MIRRLSSKLNVCLCVLAVAVLITTVKLTGRIASPIFADDPGLPGSFIKDMMMGGGRSSNQDAKHESRRGDPIRIVDDNVPRCDSSLRLATLEEYCERHNQPKYDLSKKMTPSIFDKVSFFQVIDDKHETIYCSVPKAGSSTWMSFIIQESLTKWNDSIDWDNYPIHDPPAQKILGIRHLPGYRLPEIQFRLESYYKFMVVRHPFERLVSAYNDKFNVSEFGYREYYRHYILDHFRFGRTDRSMKYYIEEDKAIDDYIQNKTDTIPEKYLDGRTFLEAVDDFYKYHQPHFHNNTHKVTFSEFLQFVLNVSHESQHDHHWQTCMELCKPCLFKYDFVGKLETLISDSQMVIERLNATSKVTKPRLQHVRYFQRNVTSKGDEDDDEANKQLRLKTVVEFSKVDPDLVKRVRTMYNPDFEAFGYSWDEEDSTSSCSLTWQGKACC